MESQRIGHNWATLTSLHFTYIFHSYICSCIYLFFVCVCVYIYVCACVLSHCRVWLSVTPWTVGLPGSSVHGIFQARILKWVATFSSRGSSWFMDQTHISCIPCISCTGRQILYHWATWEAQVYMYIWWWWCSCKSWLTLVTPWTVVCQAPLSMGISRQEYWSGLPFPSPRGSSWPKDRTYVSCIAGRFFTAEPYVYISYIYTDINILVYSHSKSHLAMEYNLLCMLLDSACYHLVDIYSINIRKECWSVVFLLCICLVLRSG